jgi:cell wall-associated NlpC family hydrolase
LKQFFNQQTAAEKHRSGGELLRNLAKYFCFVLVFVFALSNKVLAAPSQNQKYENLETSIEELDVKIEDTLHEIETNKNNLSKIEVEIKDAEKEIRIAQDNMDKEQSLYNGRIRALYINSLDGYVSILLSANGLDDFVSKLEAVNQIITYDNNLIARIKSKKIDLNNKKSQLVKKHSDVIAIKKDNEQKLAKLNADKEKQSKIIAQAKTLEKAYAVQYSGQIGQTLSNINEIRKTVPNLSESRGAAPVSANAIIAYASNYLGTPYVWGGTSPDPGFDCSGFTQYVYRHFGISLGRTTRDQIKDGYEVSRDNLQPGDLVFFGTGVPHHMGIYVGNNSFIHSPHTGDVVKISSLNGTDYLTARRVL